MKRIQGLLKNKTKKTFLLLLLSFLLKPFNDELKSTKTPKVIQNGLNDKQSTFLNQLLSPTLA